MRKTASIIYGTQTAQSISESDMKSIIFVQVRYIGVSNETSYGVMEFVHAAKAEGLPKIISIQNSYSLLVRCKFEGKLFKVLSHYSRKL